jgi:hypothetical protein
MMIEMVLSAIALLEGPEMGKVRSLLMAYQAEAIREEARLRIADILAEEIAPVPVEDASIDDLDILLSDALEDEFRTAA